MRSRFRSSLCLLAGLAILPTAPAAAAVITVTTLEGEFNTDGDCSLREAIVAANTDQARDACPSGSGLDIVAVLLPGTIALPALSGLPPITEKLLLVGNADLVIDGGNLAPLFEVNMADPTDDFTIEGNGMTVRRGLAIGHGGGALYLRRADKVAVRDVVFDRNRACASLVAGTCTGADDLAGAGGAIGTGRPAGGELVNQLEVTRSQFVGNSASDSGGALAINYDADGLDVATEVVISQSLFRGNEAGRYGGAISIATSRPIRIERSIVAANLARNGGGIDLDGPLAHPEVEITNVLIADNESTEAEGDLYGVGGILCVGRTLWLSYSTITRNRIHAADGAGGLYALFTDQNITHTAITDHDSGRDCINSAGSSLGFNLSSDGTCHFDHADDLVPASAQLSGFGAFAGEEFIALPSRWSPLVDGGNPLENPVLEGGEATCLDAQGAVVAGDLLGNPRGVQGDGNGGSECDIGAIEVQAPYAFLFGGGFESGGSWAWN